MRKNVVASNLAISRFQFNFHHDNTGYSFDFRLNFQSNFHQAATPSPAGKVPQRPRPVGLRRGGLPGALPRPEDERLILHGARHAVADAAAAG